MGGAGARHRYTRVTKAAGDLGGRDGLPLMQERLGGSGGEEMRTLLPWDARSNGGGASRLAELADEILDRCRGEGPPNCVARCPLRVDAPAYLRLTRQGKFREALHKVREKLPFPGILGFICTHPCELHCKRLDDDSPVRIRDIKRFLAEWEPGEPEHLLSREPRKGRRVVVVGSGPAGLMAAHDLRRRGFDVILVEEGEDLGGGLVRAIPPWRLPRRVVARDLSIIPALGIEVRTGVMVGRDIGLYELRRECDALLFCGGIAGAARLVAGSGLAATENGILLVDAATLACRLDGVFAAGTAVLGPVSVVEAMAHGRLAASLVAVHLATTSRREGEALAPVGSLRWRLEASEAERLRRVPTPDLLAPAGETLDEVQARGEGERCLQCSCRACVDECDYLADACDSPMELARLVKGEAGAHLEMVYSCALCGLCARVCPESLGVGPLMLQARRVAVGQGLAPLPAHDGVLAAFRDAVRPRATLLMSEPGRGKTRRLFFPGCSWPAASPVLVAASYDVLRSALPGLGVLMFCCGSPLHVLGMEEEFGRHRRHLSRLIEESGAEEVLTACPGCATVLREHFPGVGCSTMWEVLARVWTPETTRAGVEVTVQDSCRSRSEEGLHRAVRLLVEAAGATIREPDFCGDMTRCCGRGGGIAAVNETLARRMTVRRIGESAAPWVTVCAGCRNTLAGCGASSVHLMEFLLQDDWERRSWQMPAAGLAALGNRARTRYLLRRRRPLGGGAGV